MNIYESAEDYLEAILMIQDRKGVVHSIDIAEELNFSKASVSIAMKKFRENGYISMEKNGEITLLKPGREIAERIYEASPNVDYSEGKLQPIYLRASQAERERLEKEANKENNT